MVDFPINTNVHRVAASTDGAKAIDEQWFTDDITILLSNNNRAGRLILDFGFVESSIIEITRDGGTLWVPLNSNNAVIGENDMLIAVNNEDVINFRTKSAVILSYATFGDV